MNVTHDEHASQGDLKPSSPPAASAPWLELLIEAGCVGIVSLVLALVVVASVGG